MDSNVSAKLEKILVGQLKYTSDNLAFNMLINRLKRKVEENPDNMAGCIREIEDFGVKYPRVVVADFAMIASL